jgi:hypothetical protein
MPRLLTPWHCVAAAFVFNGVLFETWASRVPAVMTRFDLGAADLGALLLLLGLGALISFSFAGRLSDSSVLCGSPEQSRSRSWHQSSFSALHRHCLCWAQHFSCERGKSLIALRLLESDPGQSWSRRILRDCAISYDGSSGFYRHLVAQSLIKEQVSWQ